MTEEVFKHRKPKRPPLPADQMYPELYKTIRHLLSDDFFVLNIGGNDGVDNDPIHPFLLMYPNWNGVVVEPIKYNFEQLSYNYQCYPNVQLVQAAISDEQLTMYYVDEDAGCEMTMVSQCCSFDREYVESSIARLRERQPGSVTDDAEARIIADDSIQCLTVDELVSRYAIDRVDFLNIDVESFDFEVFQAFDLARFKPTLLCIETVSFSKAQLAYFNSLVSKYNYRFLGVIGLFSRLYARSPNEEDIIDWHSLPSILDPADHVADQY